MVETEYPIPSGTICPLCLLFTWNTPSSGNEVAQETLMKCLVAVCQEPLSSMACGVSSPKPSLLDDEA